MPVDATQKARMAALRARFGDRLDNKSQIGGKGSIRRKKRTVRKKDTQDDKKLQGALKRLNVNNIPAIEEVNLFRKGDDTVIHFKQPRVQASIAANTYVVSGNCETKKVMEMIPSIIPQLGPDNLENLKDMATQIQRMTEANQAAAAEDDDDEVPELVENVNFEDVAAEEVVVKDDDDDIPDLVETANFDEHSPPIAVSTEPNPEDNLQTTEEPKAEGKEEKGEDNEPASESKEPKVEDTEVPKAEGTEVPKAEDKEDEKPVLKDIEPKTVDDHANCDDVADGPVAESTEQNP